VILSGEDLTKISLAQLRSIRGGELSIMFQDPLASFNPVMTIGAHLRETILAHRRIPRREAVEIALEKLAAVHLPSNRVYRSFPFQLSGGMRQRAALALSLALHPRVLVADEPTTFLDVTLQRQILAELKRQLDECCLSILFITHDLAAAAAVADRVAVMYGGTLVECGPLPAVYRRPLHPYTRALLQSHPAFGQNGRLQPIDGVAAAPVGLMSGCVFYTRCPRAVPICRQSAPNLLAVGDERAVACHHSAPSENMLCAGVRQ
jgi:oligopeptide/dipeptide ABC transporter ATP-binding protein